MTNSIELLKLKESMENTIEGKTIEESLNEVKNGIISNEISKEQADKMIAKIDHLIKKNKRNLELMEKLMEKESVKIETMSETKITKEKKKQFYEQVIIDECFGIPVYSIDEIESMYGASFDYQGDDVYYFDEEGEDGRRWILFNDDNENRVKALAVRYKSADIVAMEEELSDIYAKHDEGYWYDKYSSIKTWIYYCNSNVFWLVHEKEELLQVCYEDEIIKFEGMIK